MDEEALLNLVAVLRLPLPLSKGCLPRLFLNLSLHGSTRAALLRILLSLLRLALSSDGTDGGNAGVQQLPGQSPGLRSLDDALQVRACSGCCSHAARGSCPYADMNRDAAKGTCMSQCKTDDRCNCRIESVS